MSYGTTNLLIKFCGELVKRLRFLQSTKFTKFVIAGDAVLPAPLNSDGHQITSRFLFATDFKKIFVIQKNCFQTMLVRKSFTCIIYLQFRLCRICRLFPAIVW
jgi:hypothetical protein